MDSVRRNAVVLAVLVVGQLSVVYVLHAIPGTWVDWSGDVRLGVIMGTFLALGAIAFLLFRGKPRVRFVWVAATAALPSLVNEVISWWGSDTGYRGLGFLVRVRSILLIMSGAVATLAIGIVVILTVHGYHESFINRPGSPSGSDFLPGRAGYLLIQLTIGFIAGALTFFCLLRAPSKQIHIVATILAVMAILVSLGDIFWLPVLIVAQNIFFVWFQWKNKRERGARLE
jgi:hypothetical protein